MTDSLLISFCEKRGYDIDLVRNLGWYQEDNYIKIPYDDEYIVTRTKDGQKIKPKGKPLKVYFLNGENDKIVLVEGETDALAIKHIVPNIKVCAIGGTANYKNAIRKLKYYYQGQKIIIAFDKDDAGEKCTEKTIELLLNDKNFKNADIRVLNWNPIFKDIDEYFRQYGKNTLFLDMTIFQNKAKKVSCDTDIISELKSITDQDIVVGKKIKCVNPDHNDTTPSMHIYHNHAYCFSCGYSIRSKPKKYDKTEEKFSMAIGSFLNYLDMAEKFVSKFPLFYDKSQMFWLWNFDEKKYELIDDTDLMNMIDKALPSNVIDTINSKTKNEILESLKRIGRKKIPKDAPKKWVQFKNKAYSLKSSNVYEVTPEYFFTNPIPWELGQSTKTPILDRFFTEWVGEKYVKTLYEIIAYCTYTDYPIQVLFCLHGNGRNGKSTFLKILSKFIGKENICSTELDLLVGSSSSRFESFKMYKKSVCLMGETNFGVLDKSSLLKKLTGGDMIGFEMKGKKPFDDYSYAKMLIASNSLPTSDDTSEGFYRRWIIIDFPNTFPEGKDVMLDVTDEEYSNLAKKSCIILKELLQRGEFTNQGTIEDRKLKYMMASNPLPLFLNECCERDEELYISYNQLYTEYVKYLNQHKKRRVSRKEFKISLENEGFWLQRTTKKVINKNGEQEKKSDQWIEGINVKNVKNVNISNSFLHKGNEVENSTFFTFFTFFNDKENYIKLLKLIETYEKLHCKNSDGIIPIQELQNAVTDFDIDPMIEKFKENGIFFEPKPGFIKRL